MQYEWKQGNVCGSSSFPRHNEHTNTGARDDDGDDDEEDTDRLNEPPGGSDLEPDICEEQKGGVEKKFFFRLKLRIYSPPLFSLSRRIFSLRRMRVIP